MSPFFGSSIIVEIVNTVIITSVKRGEIISLFVWML